MKRIMVTGALGQIGSELIVKLREKYGSDSVLAVDYRVPDKDYAGLFELADVRDREALDRLVTKYKIDTIYHLAAILSAKGESNPQLAFETNILGLYNVLEVGLKHRIERIIVPSSIAVFGPDAPKENTPVEVALQPTTMYGITKVTGELLGNYYYHRFGLDVRGVRLPGIISSETLPGGGTTDYAVEMFYAAVKGEPYVCFVRADTVLPMMYMPDCIKALIQLAEADGSNLRYRCSYNVTAMSFSAGELADAIREFIPDFVCEFKPDHRQKIADGWPRSLDDSAAREDWGWQPDYDLKSMTKDMIDKLRKKLHPSK